MSVSNFNGKPLKIILAVLVVATISTSNAEVVQPKMPLVIESSDLPQAVSENVESIVIETGSTDNAVTIYHDLKRKLGLSHTVFGTWLGLKRRSLYNWKGDPNSSNRSEEIEEILLNLSKLIKQMEPEHIGLTYKIAFSPLYGDKRFGEAILNGSSDEVLLKWYDQLFDKFEAYRKTIKSS